MPSDDKSDQASRRATSDRDETAASDGTKSDGTKSDEVEGATRSTNPRTTQSGDWWSVVAAGAMVVFTAFWLLAARWGIGRDDWFITPRRVWWSWGVWLLPFAILALFGGLALVSAYDRFRRAKSRGEQKTSVRLCVFALMLFALCWPWAALGPTAGGASGASNLIAATWSDVANGYFSNAYRIEDARSFSRDYVPQQQTNYAQTQAHVATHPPGATLFYFAARRAFEASPLLQTVFSSVHRNMTGVSVPESAAFARNVVAIGTGTRPDLPDSAAPCALWCAFLLSLATTFSVPAAYLLGAGNDRQNDATRAVPSVTNANATNANLPSKIETSIATSSGASTNRMANDWDQSEARGLAAASLFALAPSVGLFAFTLDALIGCLAAWTLVLVAQRLGGGAAWQMVAAGALLAFNSFFSFGALATGAVIVAALALRFAMRLREKSTSAENDLDAHLPDKKMPDESTRLSKPKVQATQTRRLAGRLFFDLAWCALGFCALWLLLCLLLPMQPLAIFARAMQAHHEATGNRNRWGWAGINLGMFALFAGWPVAIACSAVAVRSWKPRLRPRPMRGASVAADASRVSKTTRETAIAAPSDAGKTARIMGAAMLLTLVWLTLSGNVRGEVERLWMFALAPLCALAAQIGTPRDDVSEADADAAGTFKRGAHEYLVLVALLILQIVQNVLMTGALAPLVRPY